LAAAVIGLLLFLHLQLSLAGASVKRRAGIETIAAVHRGIAALSHAMDRSGPI